MAFSNCVTIVKKKILYLTLFASLALARIDSDTVPRIKWASSVLVLFSYVLFFNHSVTCHFHFLFYCQIHGINGINTIVHFIIEHTGFPFQFVFFFFTLFFSPDYSSIILLLFKLFTAIKLWIFYKMCHFIIIFEFFFWNKKKTTKPVVNNRQMVWTPFGRLMITYFPSLLSLI